VATFTTYIHLLVCLCSAAAQDVQVDISGGTLLGSRGHLSRQGREYVAFRAIPYAQPPIDSLRYKAPVAVSPWEGIKDVREVGPACAQAALGINKGEEDCLHLYVYTPKVPDAEANSEESSTLPVLVWFHGGSFVVGSGGAMDPSLLMDRDMVLVIPQYRLGSLGFFSTDSDASPGNYGMLDQVLALQWVQENIHAFGGNPNQVTLAGDCAGGASAIYHMLSPLSQGLFHGVISLSGSPLNPWAHQHRNRRFLLILANYLKCPAHDLNVLMECFTKDVKLTELLEGQELILEGRDLLVGNHRLSPMHAKEEQDLTGHFLPTHPLTALENGPITPVPVMLGVTKDVGSYLVDMVLYDFISDQMSSKSKFLEELVPMILKESSVANAEDNQQEYLQYYFSDTKLDNLTAMLPGLAQMLGDVHYHAGIIETAKLLSAHVPTRLFRFDYALGPRLFSWRHPDDSEAPPLLNDLVSHGDEMFFLLPDVDITSLGSDQQEFAQNFIDSIYNFVCGRSPRDDWPFIRRKDSFPTLVWGNDGTPTLESFTDKDHLKQLNTIHQHIHYQILNPPEKLHPKDEL
ncbi:unnamed protein product, partial [Meganyctiphanes norvegica]